MSTTTLIPYDTLKGRLAAAYKDNLMLLPGYPGVTVGDDSDVLVHVGKVTPTDTSKLEPYVVTVHERTGAKGSHCTLHCTCEGCSEWGRACKHISLTLEHAGILHDHWTYEIMEKESSE